MRFRVLSLVLSAAALLLVIGAPIEAQDKAQDKNVHIGKLVNVKGNNFTMEAKGKKHDHILAKDAKVFDIEGKECKLGDLKNGQPIRVTTREGDEQIATRVEAMKKKTE